MIVSILSNVNSSEIHTLCYHEKAALNISYSNITTVIIG